MRSQDLCLANIRSAFFFGSRIYTASGKFSVWGKGGRTGVTAGVRTRVARHNLRVYLEEAFTTIVGAFCKMKTYFDFGLKNSYKIYTHYIFTCILLMCQHYKLSGRTRKYEKWTSCRAISGRAMLSAYRCGLVMGTDPTTKTTVDCRRLPSPQCRLPMSHWIIMIDFYYMELQFILLNNKQPRRRSRRRRPKGVAATSVAEKRFKNLNEKL